MFAAWYDRPGPAHEVLQVGKLPDPHPGAGEVRVRLSYSGINPGDTKKRSDWMGFGLPFPRIIPHSDGAGVVDEIGRDVDPHLVGQRVWVFGAQSYRALGTAAQYTVIPADRVVPLPDAVDSRLGACLGIPGITAHRAVFADGPVRGRTVVVQGVLGAVGSLAAQLAHRAGAEVIGTVRRTSDLEAVRTVGNSPWLAHCIALDQDPVAELRRVAPRGADRIIEVDLGGNAGVDAALAAPGAVVAAYATGPGTTEIPFWPMLFGNLTLRFLGSDDFPAAERRRAVDDLSAATAEGALRIPIAEPLPLERIAEAHDRVDAGSRSRVLLTFDQPS
ncbi:NADPH:quinone reductase [Kineosporia sp. NBRC 101731]|uniref:NADPH:quinone reductase n=1 Tax=Kineosporia sp. NBRC 101731 TaxID=3032199 RepID=UPI00249FABCF|nr:NADPH:quinone reductase [Kineosporia sp. NBRC 101731]GLY29721.1 alcohol dehydrogenase [Kineosporia sp. NBRC 101731]